MAICRLLIQRGQYGEERYEKPEMQARVRANFDRIMAGDDTWHRVDATGTIEQVSGPMMFIHFPSGLKLASICTNRILRRLIFMKEPPLYVRRVIECVL